jgi:hypothetical protein
VTRTIALVIADTAQERRFAARPWATVVQTELQVEAVIADVYAGWESDGA